MRKVATWVALLFAALVVAVVPALAFAQAAAAVGVIDSSVTQTQLVIVLSINSIGTAFASFFGNADNGIRSLRPKTRAAILALLSIITGVCTGILQNGATIEAALVVGLTSNIGGFLVTILEAIAESRETSAKIARAVASTGAVLVFALLFAGCIAGSFEEARIAGVRQHDVSAAVSRGQSPGEAKASANLAAVAAAPSEYCAKLDGAQLWFRAIGTGLTLAAGPTVIPSFVLPEDEAETRRAFLVAAGIAAVGGGVLLMIGDGKATAWVRDCSQESPQ